MSIKPKILFIASKESSYARVDHFCTFFKSEFQASICVSDKPSYATRIFEVLTKLIKELIKSKPDMVVIGFCAQLLVFPVFIIFRGPIVLDGFISLYDTLVLDRRRFKENSFFARLILRLEKKALSLAERVLVDTEEHARFFEETLLVPHTKIHVIPVTAQENRFQVSSNMPPINTHKKLRVLFFGSFLPLQGVDVIADAIPLVSDSIQFELVGEGFMKKDIDSKIQHLKNVDFCQWLDLPSLGKKVAQADLILGVFGSNDKTLRVIPNKVIISIFHGKPVVTYNTPAIRRHFKNKENILMIDNNDPYELAKIIEWSNDNRNSLVSIGESARKLYDDVFSNKACNHLLLKAIKSL